MQSFYKLVLLLFLLTTFLTQTVAQEKSGHTFMKLGNISIDALKMTQYEQDTSANAVVLYDAGKSYFTMHQSQGLVLNFDRHVKIKILKKSGYDRADISVPLYRNSNAD